MAAPLAGGPEANPAPPERIVLNLTPEPATSIAVTWRTRQPAAAPVVQVARATARPTLTEGARSVPARSETVSTGGDTQAWHHSAVLAKLAPDTLHAYRVGDGTAWSEWSQFRTAKAAPSPFRFLFFGDPQNGLKDYCTRTFRAAFAHAPDAAFYLIAGDLVTTTIDDQLWGEYFYATDVLNRVMPGLSTPGNHDYTRLVLGGQERKAASPLYRAHFTQPENGPPGLEETTYAFDYQGVRFVCLNGNDRLPDQIAWLDRVLAVGRPRWTLVLIHQPVYSTGKTRDNPKLRDALVPVYDRHGVDLVLQGHDHSYGRTFKLRAHQRVPDDAPGTVYVVSSAGPKFYPVNPQHAGLMARLDSGLQLYQVIAIDGDRLQYESWTVTGERFDAFTLTKPAAPAPR